MWCKIAGHNGGHAAGSHWAPSVSMTIVSNWIQPLNMRQNVSESMWSQVFLAIARTSFSLFWSPSWSAVASLTTSDSGGFPSESPLRRPTSAANLMVGVTHHAGLQFDKQASQITKIDWFSREPYALLCSRSGTGRKLQYILHFVEMPRAWITSISEMRRFSSKYERGIHKIDSVSTMEDNNGK